MKRPTLFKKLTYILIALCIISIFIYISLGPLILLIAKNQIQNLFKTSSISIKTCNFSINKPVEFYDIDFRESKNDIKIKEIKLYYKIGFFKISIPRVLLKDISANINIKNKGLKNISLPGGAESPKIALVETVEVSDLKLNLTIDDINVKLAVSTKVNLAKKSIDYLDLKISSLEKGGLRLEGALLKIAESNKSGDFYVESIKYNKAKLEHIKSKAGLNNNVLSLSSLSMDFLGGNLQGDLSIAISKDIAYDFKINALKLNIETLVNDFNLTEKFNMNGLLEGRIALGGEGINLKHIKGDFFTDEPGGMLIIKDNKFLENIANNSKQSLDIVVESFKNYHYNKGIIALYLDKGNLTLEARLDGETGKRDLIIILHDFNLGKENI